MLMLLFYVGNERYACECDTIVEVIPQVALRQVSTSQEYLIGLLNYANMPIPIVDFTQLCAGRSSIPYLSTRIIIFRRQLENQPEQTLGLLAERVTDTIDREPTDFMNSGFSLRHGSFIGGVAHDTHGLIYQVLVDQLFDTVHKVFSVT